MKLTYDLHMHSCLSPCADDEMTPANMAGMAMLAGMDVVALSDHNTARNCGAFMEACAKAGLLALPAMELTTSEEAHILCLLPTLEAALALDDYVYERLLPVKNRPEKFGRQLLMDADEKVTGEEERLLLNATSIGVYDVAALLRGFGGVAVPAHIDRDSFSIISNLGFMDREMGFGIVELSRGADAAALAAGHAELRGMPVLVNSDAHRLCDMPDAEFALEADERTAAAVIDAIRLGRTDKRL